MENELIDNFQSEITQSQTDSKQRGLVKTFGWISFGIAIFYLFSGLISLVTTSLMSSVSSIASAAGNNELDLFGRIGGMQQLNAGLTALIAVLIIVGAIGFVTFREWGRKLYIAGCICAVVVNLVGIYISIYSMSVVAKMTDKMSSVSPEEAQVMESVFGTFGSFFSIIAIVFSLIPITYLVINVFIAVNSKTKALITISVNHYAGFISAAAAESSNLSLATQRYLNTSIGFRVFSETFFYSVNYLVVGTVLGLVVGIS